MVDLPPFPRRDVVIALVEAHLEHADQLHPCACESHGGSDNNKHNTKHCPTNINKQNEYNKTNTSSKQQTQQKQLVVYLIGPIAYRRHHVGGRARDRAMRRVRHRGEVDRRRGFEGTRLRPCGIIEGRGRCRDVERRGSQEHRYHALFSLGAQLI